MDWFLLSPRFFSENTDRAMFFSWYYNRYSWADNELKWSFRAAWCLLTFLVVSHHLEHLVYCFFDAGPDSNCPTFTSIKGRYRSWNNRKKNPLILLSSKVKEVISLFVCPFILRHLPLVHSASMGMSAGVMDWAPTSTCRTVSRLQTFTNSNSPSISEGNVVTFLTLFLVEGGEFDSCIQMLKGQTKVTSTCIWRDRMGYKQIFR